MGLSLPKVSIVLPVYNGEGRVGKSIESCLRQTYANIELIIVDDGSTDGTPKIIHSYADKRIKYVRHKKNMGLPNALNTGFAHSKGEYLTWTSDDNQYLPTAIEEMALFLMKNKDADLVYADYWAHYLETDNKVLRMMPEKLNLAQNNGVGACFLYTRRAYEEIGDYDPKYRLVEDYDYWIRIYKRFKVLHYPKPLYTYGEHSNSLTNTKRPSVTLFDRILRYRHHYISLRELQSSFIQFFLHSDQTGSQETMSLNTFFLYLQNVVKVSLLSLHLSLLCLLFLATASALLILHFLFKMILIYPLEYLVFLLWSKIASTHLKVVENKQNILFIIPWMIVGGAEKTVLNIAEVTSGGQFSYHVIMTNPIKNPLAWHSKFKEHFQNVVVPNKKILNIYPITKTSYGKNICYKYFDHLIEKLNVNIVLVSNSRTGSEYLPRLKTKFPNIKVIDILHSETPLPYLPELSAPYVDRRICISKYLKNYVEKRYENCGVNKKYLERLEVLYNGIDMEKYTSDLRLKGQFRKKFSIPTGAKLITFIGRLAPEKDPSTFVKIAKAVSTHFQEEFIFVMAGEGSELDRIKEMIKDSSLQNLLILAGQIENIVELLNDTYLLLVVSKGEGIPFVVLEAMSMGVPVISTNVGGIGEVIENNLTGFLINPDDGNVVGSFAAIMSDLITGKTNYSVMSEKARDTIVAKFSLEAMGVKYQNLFDELIGN